MPLRVKVLLRLCPSNLQRMLIKETQFFQSKIFGHKTQTQSKTLSKELLQFYSNPDLPTFLELKTLYIASKQKFKIIVKVLESE